MSNRGDVSQAPLPEYFRAVDRGDMWELWCREPRCKKGWAVPKIIAEKPGDLLHLLNHHRGHAHPEVSRGRR